MLGIRNQSAQSLRLRRNLDRIESQNPVIITPEDTAFYQSLRRNLGRVEPSAPSETEIIESLSIRPNANKLRRNLRDSAIAADPYPRLLLKFDNNFTDSSLWSRTVTNNGSCGFSTTANFGTHSLSLPSSSAYLSLPSSGAFNLADSDFTIECFVRFNSVPSVDSAAYFFYKDGQSSNRESAAYYSLFSGTHRLIFLYTDSGGLKQAISNISAPVANTWYHYCWERKNGTLKIFIDGVKQGSNYTVNAIIPTNQQITIGNRTPNASSFFNFLTDEMRVTVEKAIYNGADSFTPPSNPF